MTEPRPVHDPPTERGPDDEAGPAGAVPGAADELPDTALAGADGVEPTSGEMAGPPGGVERTRLGTAWVAVIVAALIGVLLVVFILQNTQSVTITYFTATGSFPLGAALFLAAVGGLLFGGVLATLRILQLRRRLRQSRRRTGAEGALSQRQGEPGR